MSVQKKQIELKAKERQATSTGGVNPQLTETFPEADKGTTRDIVAEKLNIGSRDTYRKEKFNNKIGSVSFQAQSYFYIHTNINNGMIFDN